MKKIDNAKLWKNYMQGLSLSRALSLLLSLSLSLYPNRHGCMVAGASNADSGHHRPPFTMKPPQEEPPRPPLPVGILRLSSRRGRWTVPSPSKAVSGHHRPPFQTPPPQEEPPRTPLPVGILRWSSRRGRSEATSRAQVRCTVKKTHSAAHRFAFFRIKAGLGLGCTRPSPSPAKLGLGPIWLGCPRPTKNFKIYIF